MDELGLNSGVPTTPFDEGRVRGRRHAYAYAILIGAVGDMLHETKRKHSSPAHIRFGVTAPWHREVVAEFYSRGDKFLENDPVFGVKDELIVDYVKQGDGYRLTCDFTLQAAS